MQWPGAHTPSTGGPLVQRGCPLQRGLAPTGPRAWAGRTRGPTWCWAPCLALLGMGPVGESSAGAGEPVGFSMRKPPPEKPGGSSGGCRERGLLGPGGAGGCDRLAEKRALGVGRWGGALQPPSSSSAGRGGGPPSENPHLLGVDPRKREPQKEHGTFEKPECSLGRPCTRMILSHRALSLWGSESLSWLAWARLGRGSKPASFLSTGLGRVSGVSRARRVSTRSSFVIRGEFSQ